MKTLGLLKMGVRTLVIMVASLKHSEYCEVFFVLLRECPELVTLSLS